MASARTCDRACEFMRVCRNLQGPHDTGRCLTCVRHRRGRGERRGHRRAGAKATAVCRVARAVPGSESRSGRGNAAASTPSLTLLSCLRRSLLWCMSGNGAKPWGIVPTSSTKRWHGLACGITPSSAFDIGVGRYLSACLAHTLHKSPNQSPDSRSGRFCNNANPRTTTTPNGDG